MDVLNWIIPKIEVYMLELVRRQQYLTRYSHINITLNILYMSGWVDKYFVYLPIGFHRLVNSASK